MELRYVGPHDAVDILGRTVARGETITIDKKQGAALLEQPDNWQNVAKGRA